MLYKKLLVVSFFLGIHNFSHADNQLALLTVGLQEQSEVIKKVLKDKNKNAIDLVRKNQILYIKKVLEDFRDEIDLSDAKKIEKRQKEYQAAPDVQKEVIIKFIKAAGEYRAELDKLAIDSELMRSVDAALYACKLINSQATLWDRFVWSSGLTKCAVVGGAVIVSYIAYEVYLHYFGNNQNDEEGASKPSYSSNR